MNRKSKYVRSFIAILIVTLPMSLFAQIAGVYDSSLIPAKGKSQQNEFWNNKYNFPAKPRSQWELGASFGSVTLSSDIPSSFPTFGFGVNVRKSIGYLFSLRLQYINGTAKGMMWQQAPVNSKNPAWLDNSTVGFKGNLPNGTGYNGAFRDVAGTVRPISSTINGGQAQSVYFNYKTKVQDLSLQALVSLNNILFHKSKTKFVLYGGAGVGFSAYHVMVNALDANGRNYTSLFESVQSAFPANTTTVSMRKKVWNALKAGMDNTYETEGESDNGAKMGKNSIRPSGTILAGFSYKLSNRINIAVEDRHTFVKTDLLDGQQWQVHAKGDVVQTRDFDSWNYGSIGINFNIGQKATEPLWWLNPVDFAYSEINQPKRTKFPKPVFDDADGDGVLDQLDREPNTPSGCPVDSHGVTKDTDGDGVPDCKDKQLITPTDCQPVDADGVGKCPDPECCTTIKSELVSKVGGDGADANCPNDYPSIKLKGATLSNDNKAMLATVAAKLKEFPSCTITITSYPKANKRLQALAEKKMELIKNYLTEKLGITSDRITTNSVIDGGDPDTIDIK